MAYNIKGITVEINGSASKLQEELDKVKAKTSGLNKSAKQLEKAMQIDPSGVADLALKAELSSAKMGSLASQLSLVNKSISEFPDQVKAWEQGIENAKQKQIEITAQLTEEHAKLDQIAEKYLLLKDSEQQQLQLVNQKKQAYADEVELAKMYETELKTQLKQQEKQQSIVDNKSKALQREEQILAQLSQKVLDVNKRYQDQKNTLDSLNTKLEEQKKIQESYGADKSLASSMYDEQQKKVKEIEATLKEEEKTLQNIGKNASETSQAYITQQEKVNSLRADLEREKGELQTINTLVSEATQKYNDQKKYVTSIKQEITKLESKIKTSEKAIESQTQKYAEQTKKVKEAESALEKEKTKLEEIEKVAGRTSAEYESQKKKVDEAKTSLDKENSTLQDVKSNLIKATDEIEKQKDVIKDLETEYREQGQAIENNRRLLEQKEQKLASLKVQARALTAEFNNMASQHLGNDEDILRYYDGLGKIKDAADKAYNSLKLISGLSLSGLSFSVKTATDFESAWTGVLKTVKGSDEELQSVNDGLKELATTTNSSYEDIAHFAELAGQMGIATDSVVEFTKTITELNDTTNLVGDDAAQSIAKIKNIFQGDSDVGTEYYSKMGSAIVDLGNNFATTEKDIVEMSEVMGSYIKSSGFTEQQTLALATTLSSLGVEANAGGSSMGKLIQTLEKAVSKGGDDLNSFAETANIDAQKFADAWKNDPIDALTMFLEGLGTVDNLNNTLSELGINNLRVTRGTKALTGATDLLSRALETSNNAWNENSAMDEEAALRYETTAAKLKELWEELKQIAATLGERFLPYIKQGADALKGFLEGFENMDEGTQSLITNLLLAGTAIAPLSKGIGLVSSGGQNLIKFFEQGSSLGRGLAKALDVSDYAILHMADSLGVTAEQLATVEGYGGGLKVSLSSLGKAIKTNGGLTKTLASAYMNLSTPMKAVTGLVGVGGALYLGYKGIEAAGRSYVNYIQDELREESSQYDSISRLIDQYNEYKKSLEEHRDVAQGYIDSMEESESASDLYMDKLAQLYNSNEQTSGSIEVMKEYVEALNEIYPDLSWTIDENTGKITNNTGEVMKNTDELRKNLDAVQKSARASAVQSASEELQKSYAEQSKSYAEMKSQLNNAAETLSEYQQKAHEVAMEQGADSFEYAEMSQKVLELINTYNELKNGVMESSAAMADLNAEQKALENFSETGDYLHFGETFTEQLNKMISQAQTAGIEIPQSIMDGLNGGEVDVKNSSLYYNAMSSFLALENAAKDAGTGIPQEIYSGIINNAGSVQEAWYYLQNLQDFQTMLNNAKINGELITQELAQGISDGSVSLQTATEGINNYLTFKTAVESAGIEADKIPQEVASSLISGESDIESAGKSMLQGLDSLPDETKEKFNKAIEQAKTSGQQIKDESEQDLTSEGEKTGKSFYDGITPQYDSAVSYIQERMAEIKRASNASISVTVTKNVKEKDGEGANMIANYSRQPSKIAFGDSIGNSILSSSSPEISEQIYGTELGKQLTKAISFDTSSIDRMVSKLDNVVSNLLDAKLQINIAPQQLDGNVITDTVTEITTIRDMMSKYGMGVV